VVGGGRIRRACLRNRADPLLPRYFWLNWLLGALIVVAYCSIPVWLVLRQRGKAPRMDAVQRARMLPLTGASTARSRLLLHPRSVTPPDRAGSDG
jgi:hypothetical protein